MLMRMLFLPTEEVPKKFIALQKFLEGYPASLENEDLVAQIEANYTKLKEESVPLLKSIHINKVSTDIYNRGGARIRRTKRRSTKRRSTKRRQ